MLPVIRIDAAILLHSVVGRHIERQLGHDLIQMKIVSYELVGVVRVIEEGSLVDDVSSAVEHGGQRVCFGYLIRIYLLQAIIFKKSVVY